MKPLRVLKFVFLGLMSLPGFGMLGYGIYALQRSLSAAHWPTADGRLLSTEFKTNSDSDGTSYRVVTRYEYSVHGVTYNGDKIAFGYMGSNDSATQRQLFHKLQAAKLVQVRYSPENPRTAVLTFGFHRSVKFLFVFAAMWLLFIGGITFMFWLYQRPDQVLLNNLTAR